MIEKINVLSQAAVISPVSSADRPRHFLDWQSIMGVLRLHDLKTKGH